MITLQELISLIDEVALLVFPMNTHTVPFHTLKLIEEAKPEIAIATLKHTMKTPACPRCNNRYTLKYKEYGRYGRQPLLLRCGHTFCETCLQKLPRTNEAISCPSCQLSTKVGSGHDLHKLLSLDIYTVGLLYARNIDLDLLVDKIADDGHKGNKKKYTQNSTCSKAGTSCGECKMTAATCQCVQCDCVLCQPCFDRIHRYSNTLKKHQAVPYSPATEERLETKKKRSRFCTVHEQCLIEYFCRNDQQAICSRCVIIGEHKLHDIQTLEDKNKEILSQMEPALQSAKEVIWRLDKASKTLAGALPSSKVDTKGTIDKVRQHFQELHSLIQAREEMLLEEIKEASSCVLNPIQDMKFYLTQEKQKLETAVTDAVRAMRGNSHHLLDADLILEQLLRAKDVSCVVTQEASGEPIKFHTEHQETLKDVISNYGSITFAGIQPMFELKLPSPDAERPSPEEFCLVSVTDSDALSSTDTESVTDSVIMEEGREESFVSFEEIRLKPATYPPVKVLMPGHCEKIQVTHIRTPCQFYVQRVSQIPQLKALSHQITAYCHSPASKLESLETLVPGDRVLAQFSQDKEWYRAVINSIDTNHSQNGSVAFEVFFIDYGNSEVIKLSKLRKAQKRFFKAPPFAFECSLFDIVPIDKNAGWSAESVQNMLQMTHVGPMMMTVVNRIGGVLEVDLSRPESERFCSDDRPVSVRDCLIFLEMAVFNTGSCVPSLSAAAIRREREFLTLPRIHEDSVIAVGINCIHSPFLFYAQPYGKNSQYLQQLMLSMQDRYSKETHDQYTIFCPRKGMICVAQFSVDKLWYRACIIGLPGKCKVEVQYVDYGNTEVLDYGHIRKILDDYIKFPAQAIECSLADVEPITGTKEWSNEAKLWFQAHTNLQICQFRATKESSKPNTLIGALYAVDVDTNTVICVNTELVKQGFAQSTGPWSQQDSFTDITLKTFDQEVPEMSETDLKFSFSTKASLNYPTSRPSTETRSKRKSHDKTKNSKCHRVHSSGSSPKDITLAQEKPPSSIPPTGTTIPVPGTLSVAMNICGYQSPTHFYIQLGEKQDELENMMNKLQEYETAPHSDRQWKVSEYCAARFSLDSRWYRGLITNVQDNKCEVSLVDFGFTDLLPPSELHPLKKKYGEHECFAERCHLANIMPAGSTDLNKWSHTAIEFFQQQIKGKQLFVKLEGECVDGFGLPIDILVEEVVPETPFDPPRKDYISLVTLLQDKGLAIPSKRRRNTEITPSPQTPAKVDAFHTKVVATFSSPENDFNYKEEMKETEVTSETLKTVVIVQEDFDVQPHPPPHEKVLTVVPVYVDYDGVIYAQDHAEEEINAKLIERIDHYARQDAPDGHLEVKVGQMCLAHFATDNSWYRARILEAEKDVAKVKYIDFGNSATVTRDKLKLITADLCSIPQMSYHLALYNLKPDTVDGSWPVTFLEYVHNQVVNFKCTAEIKGSSIEQPIEVELHLNDGRNLGTLLREIGVVVPKNDMEEYYQRSSDIANILKHANPYFPLKLDNIGVLNPVLVTHLDLPNLVYLQRFPPDTMEDATTPLSNDVNGVEEFIKLMEDLNSLPPQTPGLEKLPAEGEMCCAKFSQDGRWYRGLVVSIYLTTNTVLIFYIDYGNSEIVPLQRLRVLPSRFQDTPAQAVRAYLNLGLPDGMKQWSHHIYTSMIDAIYLKRHLVLIKGTEPLTVELYTEESEDGNVTLSYQELISKGLVVRPTEHNPTMECSSNDNVIIESEEEAAVPV